ncbi:MAG: GtrA family protein [Micropepsaceae bacterium]
MRIVLLYIAGALLATVANIGAQEVALWMYAGSNQLLYSIVAGTGAGLACKYLWDKKFIFEFQAQNLLHDARTFSGYALFGLVTTAVFWLFEFGFDWLFGSKAYRYLGAILGLAVGYTAKYFLDRKFVFKS